VAETLEVKGCTLFLINRKTDDLEIAAAYGLSQEYLDKGPVSALRSIADSFKDGPVAIYDVADDPRIQYPDAAVKEGIASIMSLPIVIHGTVIGALRVYTHEPWEFTLEDVNFIQAVAQLIGLALDRCRLSRGFKTSIEILKSMRDTRKRAVFKPQEARASVQGIA
jgi:GAF domain-containing protein